MHRHLVFRIRKLKMESGKSFIPIRTFQDRNVYQNLFKAMVISITTIGVAMQRPSYPQRIKKEPPHWIIRFFLRKNRRKNSNLQISLEFEYFKQPIKQVIRRSISFSRSQFELFPDSTLTIHTFDLYSSFDIRILIFFMTVGM